MDYDVPFVHGDVVMCGCEVKCFVEKVLADGWVEFLDVEANKTWVLFVFYGFKPLDCGGGAFPLVELGCSHDFAVDSASRFSRGTVLNTLK